MTVKANSSPRQVARVIPSVETSDGAGVKLRRSIGSERGLYLDPFLLLDEFGTDNPDDYIAGFPEHPHRGFETVTYMLEGRMQHRDHLGNVGELGPGGVQWMTAGRGVLHSEMPLQESGRMRGFQLWINLPAKEKMKPAGYRDIPAAQIPEVSFGDGVKLRVIAGVVQGPLGEVLGPINSGDARLSTDPLYLDVHLEPGARFDQPLPRPNSAFLYVYEGGVCVGDRDVPLRAAAILDEGVGVSVKAGDEGARMLLLAGRPLGEAVVQHGPFVMNTREEIHKAMRDYQAGTLVAGIS